MPDEARAATPAIALHDLAAGLFSLILSLRGSNAYGTEDQLRASLRGYLQKMEQDGLAAGLSKDDVAKAIHALVAFIDETILKSSWEHCERWRVRPLQLELNGTRLAGSEFFEYLKQTRRGGPAKRDLLEIYHLCLTLGFEGEYAIRGREQLRPLIEDLRRELGLPEQLYKEIRLSRNGHRRDSPAFGARDTFPFRQICTYAAGGLLLLWIVLAFTLRGTASNALDRLGG